jgi:hypothetical protein
MPLASLRVESSSRTRPHSPRREFVQILVTVPAPACVNAVICRVGGSLILTISCLGVELWIISLPSRCMQVYGDC